MWDSLCQGLHEQTQQSGARIADTGHEPAMQDMQDVSASSDRHISQDVMSFASLLMPTRIKDPSVFTASPTNAQQAKA